MNHGYHSSVKEFMKEEEELIVGRLVNSLAKTGITSQYSLQVSVWMNQIKLLKDSFQRIQINRFDVEDWYVVLEYEIPRRYKRPDTILIAGDRILVIEFKFGMDRYDLSARWQVEDYALNLRDFHAESFKRYIFPILCAVDAPPKSSEKNWNLSSYVAPTLLANSNNLWVNILWTIDCYKPEKAKNFPINPGSWLSSPYRPTMTIIEAAEKLYGSHSVREISHSYADNLDKTTEMLADVIIQARKHRKHCVCFVTGVPGAGKTLTGLNVVHDPSIRLKQGPSGIFLSGNGPLVRIVREALTNNQQKAGRKRKEAEHEVSTFIQNVHGFLRLHRDNPRMLPHEHVVVFDEAQRAWDRNQMKRKNGVDCSESAELLEIMERFDDWAVIIALVGGGQEIFLGEAGLEAWGEALNNACKDWSVVASQEVIQGSDSVAGHKLFKDNIPSRIKFREEILAHLSVSVRSHRAQLINTWVNELLSLNNSKAKSAIPPYQEFPIVLTHDLDLARNWLKDRYGGDPAKRCGLVSTSEDQRFRAYGLETSTGFRNSYSYEKWFLADPDDVRSSFMLEVSATEFECQGLELDWVGVCWGGDLIPNKNFEKWHFMRFRGSGWQKCHSESEQSYILNRYRVLLTRARLGMVIWVPPGSENDLTRNPEKFGDIYRFLHEAGVPELDTAVNVW